MCRLGGPDSSSSSEEVNETPTTSDEEFIVSDSEMEEVEQMIPSKIRLNFCLNLLSISRRKTNFSKRNLKSKVLFCLKFVRI